jgi:hypothetical protein
MTLYVERLRDKGKLYHSCANYVLFYFNYLFILARLDLELDLFERSLALSQNAKSLIL